MIDFLNQNAGAVTALATVALLCVTGWYAFTTQALLREARQSRLLGNEPRVVGYLRAHDVHSNIVQLCISNLSGTPTIGVSATLTRTTEWPTSYDLQGSNILRDLAFVRPQEVVKFDLGFGPDLFNDKGEGAEFEISILFQSVDGRKFKFDRRLLVDSVVGASWKIYGIDDVARRLEQISQTLESYAKFNRLKVDTYDAAARADERRLRDEKRELRRQHAATSEAPRQSK